MRISVWPFHTIGLFAGVIGAVLVILWWPADYPHKSELVKVSGKVASVAVRDDISNTSAGSILPGWTSTYFTLEGIDGEFRYPHTHPKSLLVRNYTSNFLDLWVELTAVGGTEPMIIWQIQEHNPSKQQQSASIPPETFVSHTEIVNRLESVDRSMFAVGRILIIVSLASVLLGIGVSRWNRRRRPDQA